jgi:ankyrin repeat protein
MNIFGVDMSFFKKLRAFFSNTYEVIACFILRRTNLNKINKNGDTALHRSIEELDYKTASRLIKCGADVHAVKQNGLTALFSAISNNNPEIVALLLKHGADVNVVNEEDGVTPLLLAIAKDNPEIVTFLLKYGADANVVSTVENIRVTPLLLAIEKDNPEIVALLLKYGADVNFVDTVNNERVTSLLLEIDYLKMEALFVLKHGADVSFKGRRGYTTPLLLAIEKDNPEMVAFLLKHGADVNFESSGVTPLILAIKNDNSEIVAFLLKNRANVNAVSRYGFTPLFYAVSEYSYHEPMTLSIVRLVIISVLLNNINAEKPEFIDREQSISTLWDESKVILNNKLCGILSFFDLCKEKDENKLARISQNKEVKKILENLDIKEKYPYLNEKIQAQFQKGLARNQALVTACNSVFTFNSHRQLNEYCWREILKNLAQEDLKNVTKVASLFFKKSPSNDSTNFSSSDMLASSKMLHFN